MSNKCHTGQENNPEITLIGLSQRQADGLVKALFWRAAELDSSEKRLAEALRRKGKAMLAWSQLQRVVELLPQQRSRKILEAAEVPRTPRESERPKGC